MGSLEIGLSKRFEKRGFYWAARSEPVDASDTVWDGLAQKDAVYYAVRAPTEEHERAKSEQPVRILCEELNRGLALDLGCGYGRIAKYLLPATEKIESYVGLDGSEAMLSLFFERHRASPVENKCPLTLIKSHIGDIPLEAGSVDNVITSAVYLHNPKNAIEQSIREVSRVLKPGGKLFAFSSFPNSFSLTGLQGAGYLALLSLVGKGQSNGPIRYFSRQELARLLEDFSAVSIYEHGGCAALPKSILVFPASLDRIYRAFIFQPSQWFAERFLPERVRNTMCTHFDVIARK